MVDRPSRSMRKLVVAEKQLCCNFATLYGTISFSHVCIMIRHLASIMRPTLHTRSSGWSLKFHDLLLGLGEEELSSTNSGESPLLPQIPEKQVGSLLPGGENIAPRGRREVQSFT